MKFKATDIKDKKEFTFEGDTLKQSYCAVPDKNIWVYERYNHLGRLIGYEVVKGVKVKNPDGQVVYKYPSTEQFGQYGFFAHEKDVPKYIQILTSRGVKSLKHQA